MAGPNINLLLTFYDLVYESSVLSPIIKFFMIMSCQISVSTLYIIRYTIYLEFLELMGVVLWWIFLYCAVFEG